jgi:GntR family transcriptional regulator
MRTSDFILDDRSPVPVYVQLQDQVLRALARGALRRGDRLPPVRELAAQLDVNPNTVNRAYAELEREGVLQSRRGLGTFVASSPRGSRTAQRVRLDELAERFVAQARSHGFDGEQIVRAAQLQVRKQR